MKIKVIKTTQASKDLMGNKVFEYKAGEVYDIYQELAETFISEGWGQEIETQDLKFQTQDLKLEAMGALNRVFNSIKDFPRKKKNNVND